MWARDLEVALGFWLWASPFVFRHPSDAPWLWANDLLVGTVVITLAVLSYVRRLRRAHLAQLVVAVWLFGLGWVATRTGETPASQNHVTLGLLLAMLAVVPSEASEPPLPWRRRWQRDDPDVR